jgi:hypothetical protein
MTFDGSLQILHLVPLALRSSYQIAPLLRMERVTPRGWEWVGCILYQPRKPKFLSYGDNRFLHGCKIVYHLSKIHKEISPIATWNWQVPSHKMMCWHRQSMYANKPSITPMTISQRYFGSERAPRRPLDRRHSSSDYKRCINVSFVMYHYGITFPVIST